MAFDRNEVQAYIRSAAQRRGIDPNTALRVIKQESGFNPAATNLSPKEQSYGLMQLNTQGGLGVHALEKGIDIRDPNTWRQQVDFGLDTVAKDGWRQWYGARDVGIGRWDGIGGRPAGGQVSPLQEAVASQSSGSNTLAGGGGNDTLSQPSGGSMAAPTVNIGLKPERSTKLYDAMIERAMANGGKSQNAWDAIGNLAQVWAASSEKKEAEAENASELQKALAGAGLDPAYAMAAQLTGGREGAASAIMAQQQDRTQAANRAEQRADRQSERDYQRQQDGIANSRADRSLALQEEVARRKGEGFRTLTPDEVKQRGLPPGSYQVGSDGKIDEVGGKGQTINVGGGENKQVFDAMDKSTEAARAAATGLKGLAEAKRALNGGIISGAGADTILGLQKVGAFMGVTDPSVIQNTETFRSAIAPQVAAMVKATVGSANISNSDREFAEKAAGGNITLDQGSILRLVDIMDRAGRATIQSHQERLNKVYPDGQTYGRERALFEIPMPEALPVPENDKLVPGSDGGGAAAPSNRTKRGVSWSVQ